MAIKISETIQDIEEIKKFEEMLCERAHNISSYDIVVNSLEEAILAAEKLKEEGYNLFRGQSGLWPVISNLNRLAKDEREQVVKKAFVIQSFALKSNIINSQDELIAVLQHYGMPTHFVDFTTDTNVAAFFTTQISGNEPNDYGCIICIDTEEIKEILNIYNNSNSNENEIVDSEQELPNAELLDISVNNLLRQEAQKGKFVFLPFVGFEIRLPYQRIVFKNSKTNHERFNESDFYPDEKSELEERIDAMIKLMNIFQVV